MRARSYLKWTVALGAVLVVTFLTWSIVHIEKYILAYLPSNLTVDKLSVSLLNRAFVAEGVRFLASSDSPCAGRVLASAPKLTGQFRIAARKLESLETTGVVITNDALRKECRLGAKVDASSNWSDIVSPEGLVIRTTDTRLNIPQIGDFAVNCKMLVENMRDDLWRIQFQNFNAQASTLAVKASRFTLTVEKHGAELAFIDGGVEAVVSARELAKVPLKNKNIRIVAGKGEMRTKADVQNGIWRASSAIELHNVKLAGKPIYDSVLLRLTPEMMWPMVEDSPGLFKFDFLSQGETEEFVAVFKRDFIRVLTKKIKRNLKRKIPIIPN